MCQFSHLHVHTQFSLLDGAAPIGRLYQKAGQYNMPALAITDHGNMFGAFEFVSTAWKDTKVVGKDADGKDITEPTIKPIVGCEFYVVEDRFRKTFTKEVKDTRYHQVLLAKNNTGYQNLLKLTSLGYIEGMYSKYPRIDKGLIEQYKEGLIATTCCIGAYVPKTILKYGEEAGEKEFQWWHNLFGNDYFVELQRHDIKEQNIVNELLIKWGRKYNVPIIATNDSHYIDREDANAHDILLCINTGEKQSTPGFDDFSDEEGNAKGGRFKFPNDQFYFKSPDEMGKLFADIPEALDNTQQIVDRVEVLQLKKEILLPAFPIPEAFIKDPLDNNLNQWEYLKHLTYEGAKKRYGEISEEARERIDFELFTIKTMGFAGYFLIVADFIQAGKDLGVYVGPGRGSAAGSVVAYCIGITNIDPIRYGLLFERFLNPDRKSMPDIDTDFDDEGRQKVIDYVVDKYGKAQVAQIVTYGTMAAKMSIKDVARVLDLPLSEANALAKLVPDKPGTELKRVLTAPLTAKDGPKSLEEKEGYAPEDLENIKRLRELHKGRDLTGNVLREAERLEGSVRNTGVHAAGIIIAPTDLTTLIPIATAKDSELWVTQYEGKVIEDAGVIKMDFLGLKTLSILKTALDLIKENHNVEIDLENLPLDDELTYQLYQRGETNATFQFESVGMQKHLRDLKPDKFEDLIAMNALYRPGPLQYIPNFIARKHGRESISYDLPEMEEYLAETYGITVYQEQVMLLSQKLAGFTKGQADTLRKAMGKKDRKTLDGMKAKFIEGASAKGHPLEKLEKIWTDWEAFAQYAFNKSHSTCYAYVAYHTGYLKAHYPSEFMSATLNHAGDISKITFFMEECRRMGIKVLGPDINESKKGFAPNVKGEIRFGLGGLKGVGEAAVESIIEERKTNGRFKNVFDFIKRINQRTVNKKSLEALVYSGAFDCFTDLHRAQYFTIPKGEKENGLEKIVKFGNACQSHSGNTLNTLFGNLDETIEIAQPKILPCEPWTLTEMLNHEKEVTGMFMSGHPLDHFAFELQYYGILPLAELNELMNNPELTPNTNKTYKVAGLVVAANERTTKAGKNFGNLSIEDYSGKTEFTMWSNDYARFHGFFKTGLTIFVTGNIKARMRYTANQEQVQDGWEFKVNNILLIESLRQTTTRALELSIHPGLVSADLVNALSLHTKKPGSVGMKIKLRDTDKNYEVELSGSKGITISDGLAEFLYENRRLIDTKVVSIE